ncbi:helix-turn-helix transcriptional regulator [Rhodopirellula baltica]|uniref:Helix-turn-helix domain containing protein, type 11 n=1 Tax=Rhodopirellula baltica WH47 TaxID=991778 RepID=F2AUH4_RHOBT|nr:WYL domain-containing protein [Rhodopirellula baltica]EGF26741.1 Helix-turn-helix domain containing protein, type 11 [Rhodopirellula baltica WH47]
MSPLNVVCELSARPRQDAIVRLLRRNGTMTIAGLVTEVGASRRTVLRDISALRDQGFVIHSEPGRGGGLQLDPQSVLTTARLSVSEVFALIISVSAMRATGSIPFLGLADTGLAKIEKALPTDKIRDLRRLLKCLYVGTLAPQVDITNMGKMTPTLLPAFETAFLRRLHLQFQYRDAKGVETRRKVEPQAVLILPPLWYLVAWDPARDDFRHFRMDRISRPQFVEGETFRRRHVPFEDHVRPVREPTSRS